MHACIMSGGCCWRVESCNSIYQGIEHKLLSVDDQSEVPIIVTATKTELLTLTVVAGWIFK